MIPVEFNTLKLEMDGNIARLTLNRPERANSMTMEMGRELASAMETLRASPTVRVLVLTGAASREDAEKAPADFKPKRIIDSIAELPAAMNAF